jgi:hypothetical protein
MCFSLTALCLKTTLAVCFWVAQRFSAAITGLFSVAASAAEVKAPGREEFFSNLL